MTSVLAISGQVWYKGQDELALLSPQGRFTMAKRRSKARQTRDEAREAYLTAAAHLWDEFSAWYDAHPNATYREMELELRNHRRVLMGETLALTLRRGELGASAVAPRCERCGREMVFKGYPDKEVRGLEGEADIPRAYYVCPPCEAGIFPPGPTSEPETGLLE
jgi:hypothetical protein